MDPRVQPLAAILRLNNRLLLNCLDGLTTRFPGVDATRYGALTFLVQHDSYYLGQLSLLRKPAGPPAMSYR